MKEAGNQPGSKRNLEAYTFDRQTDRQTIPFCASRSINGAACSLLSLFFFFFFFSEITMSWCSAKARRWRRRSWRSRAAGCECAARPAGAPRGDAEDAGGG